MSNFIKFKLKKNIERNQIEFTLIKFNPEHPVFTSKDGRRLHGFSINHTKKKIKPITSWCDGMVDSHNFSVYFTSDGTNLNNVNGENELFYIGYNQIGSIHTFKPKEVYGNIDFWYDRIIQSFKILGDYKNV